MRFQTTWSFVVCVLLTASTAFDIENLYEEKSDTLFRQTRQTEGSGDLDCAGLNSVSQTCKADTEGSSCVCLCEPGYYGNTLSNNSLFACGRVKTFLGQATFTDSYNTTQRTQREIQVKAALQDMFVDELFVDVRVTKLTSGSTLASYELYFKYDTRVDTNYVKDVFNDNNNCSEPNSVVGVLTLNLTKSCITAVTDGNNTLCESASFQGYCDNATTACSSIMNGIVTCPCKTGFYPNIYNPTVCIEKICTTDSDCNQPFGWCVAGANSNYCKCMWGFMGTYCYAPWMFTLTIVAGGCGIIIIILFFVLICSKRGRTKSSKHTYVSPDSDLRHHFNDFQPGIMRARVPNTNDYITSAYQQEMKVTSKDSSHSRNNSAVVKNGHTNHAYDGTLQSGSSTFGSPMRSSKSREPTDYF